MLSSASLAPRSDFPVWRLAFSFSAAYFKRSWSFALYVAHLPTTWTDDGLRGCWAAAFLASSRCLRQGWNVHGGRAAHPKTEGRVPLHAGPPWSREVSLCMKSRCEAKRKSDAQHETEHSPAEVCRVRGTSSRTCGQRPAMGRLGRKPEAGSVSFGNEVLVTACISDLLPHYPCACRLPGNTHRICLVPPCFRARVNSLARPTFNMHFLQLPFDWGVWLLGNTLTKKRKKPMATSLVGPAYNKPAQM